MSYKQKEKDLTRWVVKAYKNWEIGKRGAFQKEREQAVTLFEELSESEQEQFPGSLKRWLFEVSLKPFGESVSESPSAISGSFEAVPRVFQELAKEVHCRWNELSYDEKVFHEVATEALKAFELHEKIDSMDPARWSAFSQSIWDQRDREQKFGEPPVTVYRGDRFDIDIYYWLDGTTGIHEHGFCGALGVLDGSSIHSHYDFEETERFNSRLAIGDLKLRSCELLTTGDVRPIIAGEGLIHALFHLERPSVSIVIRTAAAWTLPQRHFMKPRIALASNLFPDEISRHQSLNMMGRLKSSDFINDLQTVLNTCPPDEFVHLLIGLRFHLGHSDHLSITLDRIVPERRDLLKEVIASIKEQKRMAKLAKFRASTSDVEERFLLALLLNIPDCGQLLEFIRNKWPDEPPVNVMDRIFTRMFGRAAEPPFDLPVHDRTAFLCAKILNGSKVESFDSDLRDIAKKIAKNSILRPFVSP